MELGGIKMFVLLTYDIDQSDGGRRLHRVAQICENFGTRVQNSVFEMDIDLGEMTRLKSDINEVIDQNIDSVRIYKLGKLNKNQVEILGVREKVEISKDLGIFM